MVNLQRRTVMAALMVLMGVAGQAHAEYSLKDNSEIVGSWTLESVSSAIDKYRTPENRTWEFKADGALISSGYNRVIKVNDRMSFSYKVENGKIILLDPGRPNKPQTYEVYDKTDKSMILKGGSEGFYFFKR